MTADYRDQSKKMAAAKLKSYGGKSKDWAASMPKGEGRKGFAFGGVVGGDDDGPGAMADGGMGAPRMDRPAPKAKGKSGTVVNVIIAGKGDAAGASAPPPMPPPPMAAAPPPMPPHPPMPPPGGPPMGAGGPPPGMGGPPGMPPMHAKGGRVAYASGGTVGLDKIKKELPKTPGAKQPQGKVPMDGGGGGALGRLEKIRDYGKRSS